MPRLRDLFAAWGPAWLVMIADVDAASVITAAESGAVYGTKLIWFLLILIIPLYVIQEVAGRVGAVVFAVACAASAFLTARHGVALFLSTFPVPRRTWQSRTRTRCSSRP